MCHFKVHILLWYMDGYKEFFSLRCNIGNRLEENGALESNSILLIRLYNISFRYLEKKQTLYSEQIHQSNCYVM